MIRNYFKIAFRNLWRHRVFSFINILGLSVGMSACLLIYLYVSFELSYDRYHAKGDRIFRVVTNIKTPTDTLDWNSASIPMSPAMKKDFPEVEQFVRIEPNSLLVSRGETKFQEDKLAFADSSLFSVFTLPLVKGDPDKALAAPWQVVLTETSAKKYFGTAEPVGQTLYLTGSRLPATVTGVMKDFPDNSHFKYDILVSMTTWTQKINPGLDDQWEGFNGFAYVLLHDAKDAPGLKAKLPAFIDRHIGKDLQKAQMTFTLDLEPMKDIYLRSKRGAPESGSLPNITIFSLIAVFILLIASINFINLATARSAERAKEVGIRKVVGADRKQLTGQFLGESVLLCMISFLMAVGLCALLLHLFNQLSGKTIIHGIFDHASTIGILLLIAITIGLFAGIYPALVLSGFRPIAVLKGSFSSGKKGILLRKGLVVSQFVISIALITGTLVVYSQLTFMRNQDLGFSKQQQLVINFDGDSTIWQHYEAFKQQLTSLPNALSATASSAIPGQGNPTAYSQLENHLGVMQPTNMELFSIDYDVIKQYGIQIVAGRPFSTGFPSDSTRAILVNEEAVSTLGYHSPQEIIGKKFSQWGRQGTIIGVVKNFHFRGLQNAIKPMDFRIRPRDFSFVTVKISGRDVQKTIAAAGDLWRRTLPNRPFAYYFADEEFNKLYRSEDQFGQLFLNFAILAIFISCLGLLGLASYSTLQRTKEIGIRKVLGSSVGGIVNLLSKDFLKLVWIAFLIASPLAYIGMHKWLQDFAYRIDMDWWIFAMAGMIAMLIALFTVSFHAVRSALANPTKSLRTE
ncbi:MAG: ABC transporter permease [Bacteroidota bacterium]|nr:ABC transporter permease [Bacteroidota bacterium]